MTRDQADALVHESITMLIRTDAALLDLDVSERSLSHQLALHMSMSPIVQPPLTVDCEYNRHFSDPKRLKLPSRKALDCEIRATTVFPDIVVHERNTGAKNLVVLELKKPGEVIAYDELKLRAFQDELGYQHCAHVILGKSATGELIRQVNWIDN